MLDLQEVMAALEEKKEITVNGELFKVRNAVRATDGNILKIRVVLEQVSRVDNIEVDVGISARIYKR